MTAGSALRAAAWLLLGGALVQAATGGLDRLSADAVVYLRLAGLYAGGRADLAVTPYWGPLFPWLVAPLLRFGVEPLLAGRIVLAGTGLLFVAATLRFARVAGVPRCAQGAAGVLAGLFVVARTGEAITPDLLLSAFVALAFAEMAGEARIVRTGCWMALAALSKPVGLPITVLAAGLVGCVRWLTGESRPLAAAAGLVARCTVAGLLLAPWAWAIVNADGWEGIARTARVNHALVGPSGEAPEHPGTAGFRRPKAGHLTTWESPTGRGYTYWSPTASWQNFVHQLKVFQQNIRAILNYLLDLDLLALGPIAALAGLALHRPWRENMRRQRWRWAGIPFLCVCAVYLPVYSSSFRYYYPVYPFVLTAAFGMVAWLLGEERYWRRRIVSTLVFVSLALPLLEDVERALGGARDRAVVVARAVAERLEAEKLYGAVAGDGPDQAYLAFFLDAPWFGWSDRGFSASEARLVAVRRGSDAERRLAGDAAFEDLDPRLYGTTGAVPPVRVFRRRP